MSVHVWDSQAPHLIAEYNEQLRRWLFRCWCGDVLTVDDWIAVSEREAPIQRLKREHAELHVRRWGWATRTINELDHSLGSEEMEDEVLLI